MDVLRLYFMGYSYDEIGTQTRVSKGSVVNIIKELKSGVYPEFDHVIDQIDALRTLAVDLKKRKTTIALAILGSMFMHRFLDLGVEPKDVKAWMRLCRNLVSPKYPLDQFMRTAVELMRLEEQTGLDSDKLLQRYRELVKQISEKENERTTLANEVNKATALQTQLAQTHRSQKQQIQAKLQKLLDERNLTLNKLDHVSKLIPHELMKTGLNQQSVDQVIASAKVCGSLMQFTELLTKEKEGLEGDINELTQIRTTLEERIEWEKYNLFLLNQQYHEAVTRKNNVMHQLERGMDAIDQQIDAAKKEFSALTEDRQRVIDEIQVLVKEWSTHKTELQAAAVLFRLLEESHSITTYDLKELVKRLNWIIQIKQGKAKHLRYYLVQISETAKQRLIDLCSILLKDDFVSKQKYRDLEQKHKKLESKQEALENKYQDNIAELEQKLEHLEMEIRNQVVPHGKYELERPQARKVLRV
jgi:hypothetical protein